jgi:hypothetical protein
MVNQEQIEAAIAFQNIKFEEAFGQDINSHKIIFLHHLMTKMNEETYAEFLLRFLQR